MTYDHEWRHDHTNCQPVTCEWFWWRRCGVWWWSWGRRFGRATRSTSVTLDCPLTSRLTSSAPAISSTTWACSICSSPANQDLKSTTIWTKNTSRRHYYVQLFADLPPWSRTKVIGRRRRHSSVIISKTAILIKYKVLKANVHLYSALRKAPVMRSDMDHTVLPANYTMPAFTPQPQNITALWLVLIHRPTEGRRLSRPG